MKVTSNLVEETISLTVSAEDDAEGSFLNAIYQQGVSLAFNAHWRRLTITANPELTKSEQEAQELSYGER